MRSGSAAGPDGAPGFLSGGGELGALMRATDWSVSPLGEPDTWPQSLKTAIRIMLTSRQPIWIGWGQDLLFFYNDAYRSIIGGKHPEALGQPTKVVWREIWADIGPMLATAMSGSEGTYVEEQLLIMERNGYPEETYYTFSYSPIPDDDGTPGGIICANTEDTNRVIGERQLTLLREIAARTTDARTFAEACDRSLSALSTNRLDLPFALLYLTGPDGRRLDLAGTVGIDPGHPAAPASFDPEVSTAWPLEPDLRLSGPRLVHDLRERFTDLPTGGWQEPPRKAALLPILPAGEAGRSGVLIVGLSPFRLYDADYRGFLELAAGQIAASIGYAEAYEDERRRAEALAEIDRAKTIFFSNVSHEFRTPLTLMLGPLEDLLARAGTGPDAAPDRALLEVAARNSRRLLKLVNALLDFSRIEAGRVQTSFEPVDLATFTADLASTFRSAMDRAGLTFAVTAEPLPAPVHIDRDMWEKVVLNLLSNAFKFTLDGSVTVSIGASADGQAAEVTVRDTGIGIPEHELPRIFDRFHRVEGARGRTIEGSGIGLALVHELVKLHGGTVSVESEHGRGTAFRIRLPFGTRHLPEGAVGRQVGGSSTTAPAGAYVEEALRWLPDGDAEGPAVDAADTRTAVGLSGPVAGSRVLVVDDNTDLRAYMDRLLTAAGFVVETAEDGEAGLGAARRFMPEAIVSDVMMPKLDGFGLLAALRSDPAMREIPFILLSARAGEEARLEGLGAGADDYLAKPFSARELVGRITSNIQLARLRRETEAALREETRTLETLNRVGTAVAAELDLERAVQTVTDAATELTGAAYGAFFYNVVEPSGESYLLYALSGVPRETFERFPMPRNTDLFAPTFAGRAIVRSDDVAADPRFGRNAPHRGLPGGHLAVVSYLAAPVVSRTGEVLGGLFFGHPERGVFSERAERLVTGIAAQAAAAIDNARLYLAAQAEIEARVAAQTELQALNDSLEVRIADAVAERDRLWDLSEDLLVVADVDGQLRRVSPSWERMFGKPASVLTGRSGFEFVHPDDRAAAASALTRVRQGEIAHVEVRMRAESGADRHIGWTLSPEPGTDRFHGVGRDVTADREAERALRQAEEALRLAQKMEAIGKLTGGVAHDFNNLLQVIGGNLQLLVRDLAGNERAEQRLRSAIAGVTRGAKLASQLLAFGRRQPLAPKVVNLGRFVRGMDDMLRRALGDGIEIETVVTGGLWNALVDPFQVENALLNLAINARDAMKGHGRLTIEAGNALLDEAYAARHGDVKPGQYVMLAVTDTGCGMTTDVLEHVFEPFFTTKPEGQGTGLGLSMVYGFVKQSDGHIGIYSEPDHGTTVRIYLPRMRQEEDVAVDVDAGPVTGGSETVLVVEDDEDVRATVVDLLADLGYRVLKARDAQSALAIVESGMPVDLLFTDVVMPGPLRSPELARKARERLPDIKVLFTSGYTDNAIVHGGRLDDGIDLLSKPYTREALARKIRAVLKSEDRGSAAPSVAEAPSIPEEEPAAPRALRILLVEDESLIRLNTADILVDAGHTVHEAASAPEALAILDREPVDVLLTDVGLPGMSGVDLAIACLDRWPWVSVVFASGHDKPPGIDADGRLVRSVLLRKPYQEQDLHRALRTASPA